jgi:hypothetical protein
VGVAGRKSRVDKRLFLLEEIKSYSFTLPSPTAKIDIEENVRIM